MSTRYVLLADDDDAFRAVMRGTLERHGYAVLEADDGAQALALWQRHRSQVGVVVSDVRMPSLTGPEFVARVHADDARVPVVYVSGTTEEVPREPTHVMRLSKPCSAGALISAVTQAWRT